MAGRIFVRALFLFGVVLICASCVEKRKVSLSELKAFPLDPDNGLIKRSESGDMIIEMIYRPKDLVIKQIVSDNLALWDSISMQLENYDYFVLRISKNSKAVEAYHAGVPGLYAAIVDYLNEDISSDITMFVGNKELKVSDALFSPAYGMENASSVLLIFESNLSGRKEDFRIVFEDSQLGSGRHEFDFDFSYLQKTPQLRNSD